MKVLTAIIAGTLDEAKASAAENGLGRKSWFYACSVEAATGRAVDRIIFAGNYGRHKRLPAIVRELRGCQLHAGNLVIGIDGGGRDDMFGISAVVVS